MKWGLKGSFQIRDLFCIVFTLIQAYCTPELCSLASFDPAHKLENGACATSILDWEARNLGMSCAPYVLYGVKHIDLVSHALHSRLAQLFFKMTRKSMI